MEPADASPTLRPRWERRKESRPTELIAAALELFVEKGFAGTRLDDVAARAGVSKGTLYLYFANKEELLRAAVQENLVPAVEQARAAAESFEGPTADLLRMLLEGWWQRIGATPACGISKLMVAESGNFPEVARLYYDEVIRPVYGLLGRLIERGAARGEFRRVDTENFVRVMTAPVVMLMLWKHSFGPCCNDPIDPHRYLDAHIDLVIQSLRPAAPPPRARPRKPAGRRGR